MLCAVFIPVSFLGGLAGELYRQFAVTIAVSVVISGIVALTLTPALCALLLKPGARPAVAAVRLFNRVFAWLTARYTAGVGFLLRRAVLGCAGLRRSCWARCSPCSSACRAASCRPRTRATCSW